MHYPAPLLTDQRSLTLRADLTNTDWSFVEESTNVDDAYGLFLARFNELLNFNLPMVGKNLKGFIPITIIPGLVQVIMDTNKTYQTKLTNVIRYAERQYYQDKFELAKCNVNKTWQILKTVINPNTQNKPSINKLVIDDLLTAD